MKVAVSGSHSTGKSTLIAAFIESCPHYLYEPEAYEVLADEIGMTPSEGPDVDGLVDLLEYTISVLASHRHGASVIFERSPVDYLAYAAASESIPAEEREQFLRSFVPAVRDAMRDLDMIVLLKVSSRGPVGARPGEDEAFRLRVDGELRSALIDDEYDLFEDSRAPLVFELPESPELQLEELIRQVELAGPS